MEGLLIALGIGGFVALIVGIIVISVVVERKRRQALAAWAAEQGFTFEPDDQGRLEPYRGFKLFGLGHSRRTRNVIVGRQDEFTILVADYRYTTGHGKNSSTHHQTVCIMEHERLDLPHCYLRRQYAFFDSLGRLFGGQDIDFDEDAEFSKRYVLQGEDEEATRAAFDERVRGWFREQEKRHLQVECRGRALLLHRGRRLKLPQYDELIRDTTGLVALWMRPPWLRDGAASEPDGTPAG